MTTGQPDWKSANDELERWLVDYFSSRPPWSDAFLNSRACDLFKPFGNLSACLLEIVTAARRRDTPDFCAKQAVPIVLELILPSEDAAMPGTVTEFDETVEDSGWGLPTGELVEYPPQGARIRPSEDEAIPGTVIGLYETVGEYVASPAPRPTPGELMLCAPQGLWEMAIYTCWGKTPALDPNSPPRHPFQFALRFPLSRTQFVNRIDPYLQAAIQRDLIAPYTPALLTATAVEQTVISVRSVRDTVDIDPAPAANEAAPVRETAAATSHPAGETTPAVQRFPKRAAWLKERLRERGWNEHDLQRANGPEHRTGKKILAGSAVQDHVLSRVVIALQSKMSYKGFKLQPIEDSDVPKD
jgi:hypothetical protein